MYTSNSSKYANNGIDAQDKIKRNFVERMRQNLKKLYYDQLGLLDWEQRAKSRIEGKIGESYAKEIEKHIKLRNKRVLDVGCGWGEFIVSANMRGAEAVGIEPDKEQVELCKTRLTLHGMKNIVTQKSN